jgi:hypothetical protein
MENFITGMKQGVEAGNEMIYGGERDKAQNELLSTQAQTAQFNLQTRKTEATNTLAAQAGLSKVAHDNVNLDLTDVQGQIQQHKMAIAATSDPAIQEVYRNKIKNLEVDQAELTVKKEAARQATMESTYSSVNEALTFSAGPEAANTIRDLGKKINDPHLNSLANVLEDKMDVPGVGGKFSSLSPDDRKDFLEKVRVAMLPNKDKAAELYARTQMASNRDASREYVAEQLAASREQVAAAKKEGQSVGAEAKLEFKKLQATVTHNNEISKIEDKQQKILDLGGVSSIDEGAAIEKHWYGDSKPKLKPYEIANYNRLEADKQQRIKDFNTSMAKLGADVSTTPKRSDNVTISGNFTPEEQKAIAADASKDGNLVPGIPSQNLAGMDKAPPQGAAVPYSSTERTWLNAQLASHPGMTEEEIAVEGRKLGRIKTPASSK